MLLVSCPNEETTSAPFNAPQSGRPQRLVGVAGQHLADQKLIHGPRLEAGPGRYPHVKVVIFWLVLDLHGLNAFSNWPR